MKIQVITTLLILLTLLTFQNSSAQQRVEIEGDTWVKEKLEINRNGANFGEFIWNPTGFDLRFYTNFLERFVINNDGSIDTKTNKITNLGNPTESQDAVTKAYVDNILIQFGISIGTSGVQGLLDAGFSALTIINAGADTVDFIGLNHAGGIIFYMKNDGTGLVAAPIDAPTTLNWGNNGGFGVGCNAFATGATLMGIGDGVTNTMTVLNAACDSTGSSFNYVDTLSLGNYDDWFLPSLGELNLMWKNLHRFGCPSVPPETSPCPSALGGFAPSFYWSSTEGVNFTAFYQGFSDGDQIVFDKDQNFGVRAIRAFP